MYPIGKRGVFFEDCDDGDDELAYRRPSVRVITMNPTSKKVTIRIIDVFSGATLRQEAVSAHGSVDISITFPDASGSLRIEFLEGRAVIGSLVLLYRKA
jgi:hypothetical protein